MLNINEINVYDKIALDPYQISTCKEISNIQDCEELKELLDLKPRTVVYKASGDHIVILEDDRARRISLPWIYLREIVYITRGVSILSFKVPPIQSDIEYIQLDIQEEINIIIPKEE